MDYTELTNFKGVFLEDSFVLSIKRGLDIIIFECDFVLTEENYYYQSPKEDEQYCYRKGSLIFKNILDANWFEGILESYFRDANDEFDLGNIDLFQINGDSYYLEGDWGKVTIVTNEQPQIIWEDG
jgi:hypothetical protein